MRAAVRRGDGIADTVPGDRPGCVPHLEVHTVVRGSAEVAAPTLWLQGFGTSLPRRSGAAQPVAVTVSGVPAQGSLLAAAAEGWMVCVAAPDATVLVMGPGEPPHPLALEPVDMSALRRSEFRNSGMPESGR